MLTPERVPVPLGLMLRGDGHHQAITQIPCAVKRMTGSKGPGSEGLPKVTCQPSQVMGQPVQRLWGRNEHVIKQQKGSEWTSAEYGCALGEIRSQSCDHGEDGTLTQGEIGVFSGTQAERCHRIFGLLVFETEFFLQQF